jgi:hypothetical protein
MNPRVIKAIAVTAELTGSELSETAIRVMESDLSAYPEDASLRALDRCRKELKGRLTLAAVLERVTECDGRPGKEEAWSIALASSDEAETVVWTDEIAQAMAVAQPLLDVRDKVAARMSFCEKYEALVRDAREAKTACRWSASIGTDSDRRSVALSVAVAIGRIEHKSVARLLPGPESANVVAGLIGRQDVRLLADIPEDYKSAAERGIRALREHLSKSDQAAQRVRTEWQKAESLREAEIEQRRAEARRILEEARKCNAESAGDR